MRLETDARRELPASVESTAPTMVDFSSFACRRSGARGGSHYVGLCAADAREHLSPAEIRGVERLRSEWKEQHALSPEVAGARLFALKIVATGHSSLRV